MRACDSVKFVRGSLKLGDRLLYSGRASAEMVELIKVRKILLKRKVTRDRAKRRRG